MKITVSDPQIGQAEKLAPILTAKREADKLGGPVDFIDVLKLALDLGLRELMRQHGNTPPSERQEDIVAWGSIGADPFAWEHETPDGCRAQLRRLAPGRWNLLSRTGSGQILGEHPPFGVALRLIEREMQGWEWVRDLREYGTYRSLAEMSGELYWTGTDWEAAFPSLGAWKVPVAVECQGDPREHPPLYRARESFQKRLEDALLKAAVAQFPPLEATK